MTDGTKNLLSGAVRRKLHRLRSALRVRLFAEGLAWVVLAAFAAVLLTLAIDYTLRLERSVRMVLTSAAAAGLLVVLVRQLLLPLLTPMNLTSLALLVERRRPVLADRLISAIQLTGRCAGVSEHMVRQLAREADEIARKTDFRGIVERRRLFHLVSAAGCSVALLAGLGIWQNDLMVRYLRRNLLLQDVHWPQKTYLRVEGDDFTVLRGDDLEVVVSLEPRSRVAPPYVTVHANYPSVGRAEQKVEPASPEAGEYVMVFRRVTEPFEFHVTGGDDRRDRRDPHRVHIVPAATLEELSLVVYYPDYTRRSPRRYAGGQGMIVAPAGSRIGIEGLSSKDLRSAALHVEGEEPRRVDLNVRDFAADGENEARPRRIAGQVHVPQEAGARTLTLRFELTDTEGFTSRRGQQIICQVEPDTAPLVSLTCPALGRSITPQASLPLLVEMEDDYGIASASAVVRRIGSDEPVVRDGITLPERSPERVRIEHELDLRRREVKEGDTLRVTVEADDTLPADAGFGGPNVGVSPALEFDVVSPDDLMGELVRRQKELRLEFVQAIAAQTSAEAHASAAAELAATGEVTPEVRRRLGASAQLQQNVSAECVKAAEALAGLLAQMQWNRVGSDADHRQLLSDVVEPLERLIEPTERIAAELQAAGRLTGAAEAAATAEQLAADQREVLRRMEQIAEHMQKLQTRQDLARQLRSIIRMSEDLRDRVRRRQEEGVMDIFEPEEAGPAD